MESDVINFSAMQYGGYVQSRSTINTKYIVASLWYNNGFLTAAWCMVIVHPHTHTCPAKIWDKIRLLVDGFYNLHNYLQHMRLFEPLPFVRRFASEFLFSVHSHSIQTKPNNLLAWTFPNIVRNLGDFMFFFFSL